MLTSSTSLSLTLLLVFGAFWLRSLPAWTRDKKRQLLLCFSVASKDTKKKNTKRKQKQLVPKKYYLILLKAKRLIL